MWDTQGFNKILGQNGGQAWHQTGSRCSGSSSNLEIAKNGTSFDELPGFCELLHGIHQEICGQGIPDATVNETQRQEVHVEQRSRRIIPENKERVVRGTGVGDANGKRDVRVEYGRVGSSDFWRPIAYGSKVLKDTEMKYGAPKAEMFAVVTFVEKYRAYLGSEPFKLRVDNRALS